MNFIKLADKNLPNWYVYARTLFPQIANSSISRIQQNKCPSQPSLLGGNERSILRKVEILEVLKIVKTFNKHGG
jgi:hypothetical protein